MRILVRHTRPAVESGVCYGSSDVALAEGASEDIARSIATLAPAACVYTSPAQRCLRLAQALAVRDGARIVIDERLRELDFGAWELRRWDDVPRAEVDAWAADLWRVAPGGGESLAALWARVADFRGQHFSRTPACTVVGHLGPLRALYAQEQGWSWREIFGVSLGFGATLDVDAPLRMAGVA